MKSVRPVRDDIAPDRILRDYERVNIGHYDIVLDNDSDLESILKKQVSTSTSTWTAPENSTPPPTVWNWNRATYPTAIGGWSCHDGCTLLSDSSSSQQSVFQ